MAAKKRELINADVHICSSPMDAPAGTLTRCLFGMSVKELAEEISMNKDGKWDGIFEN